MYYRTDGQRLKTKIVATIGEEDSKIFDNHGQPTEGVKYEDLFSWFVQRKRRDCFMVDVFRLNMAFYASDGETRVYERVFQWLRTEKDGLAKNAGVLCDLAGAKTRLGEIKGKEIELKQNEPFKLSLGDNRIGTKDQACVLAYGKPLSEVEGYHQILNKLRSVLKQPCGVVTISIGDGKVILEANQIKNDVLYCVVKKEGRIKSRQGVTFEEIDLGLRSFGGRDQDALTFLLDLDRGQGLPAFIGKLKNGEAGLKRGEQFMLSIMDDKIGTSLASVLTNSRKPIGKAKEYKEILRKLKKALGIRRGLVVISIGEGDVILNARQEKNGILYCSVRKAGVIKSDQRVTFYLDKGQGFLAYIGVSFVRVAQDVLNVKKFVEKYFTDRGYSQQDIDIYSPDIIAKIETQQGADGIEGILDVADGAMVARGDLALQLGREEVPEIQKNIITLCNQRGKVVITATEMLASMEDSPRPSRAEVNDVFNAILDGTDAVMLSGETASGKYPAQAVQYMAKIAEKAEVYFEKIYRRGTPLNAQRLQEMQNGSGNLIKKTNKRLIQAIRDFDKAGLFWETDLYKKKLRKSQDQGTTDRICVGGCELAEEGEEKREFEAIVASTASGRTVRMISRFRPSVKLIGVARNEITRRKLLLSYGACPINIGPNSAKGKRWKDTEQIFTEAARKCTKEMLTRKGVSVIFIGGNPIGELGKVNILQIKQIPE